MFMCNFLVFLTVWKTPQDDHLFLQLWTSGILLWAPLKGSFRRAGVRTTWTFISLFCTLTVSTTAWQHGTGSKCFQNVRIHCFIPYSLWFIILWRRAEERTESHFTSRGLTLPSANENKNIVPLLESSLVAISEKHSWRGKRCYFSRLRQPFCIPSGCTKPFMYPWFSLVQSRQAFNAKGKPYPSPETLLLNKLPH